MMLINKIKQIYRSIIEKIKDAFQQPDKRKILGMIGIVLFVIGILILIIVSVVSAFAPANSVTILVVDQYDEPIDGLEISISNEENSYIVKFSNNMSKSRALDVVSGDYSLDFYTIPNGYTCFTVTDSFTLKKNGKIKLEYECFKSE